MRVLWLIPGYAPAYGFGGPIESSHRMCEALRCRSVDVRVVTTQIATDQDDMAVPTDTWTTYEEVPVFYAHRYLRHLISPRFVTESIEQARTADVVHVTGLFDATVPMALGIALRARVPVVLSARGVLEPWSLSQKRWKKVPVLAALRPLLERVDAFHATSEKERRSIEDLGFRNRIAVVPNGVALEQHGDLALQAERVRPRLGVRDDQPLLVMLGRIHPVKGIDVAIEALARLRGLGVDAVLVIAGPDEIGLRSGLSAQAAQLGVASALRWPGMLRGQDKYALLRAADLLLLPSRQENFGNVVVEALSVETPVLASHETPWQLLETEGVGRWLPLEPQSFAIAAEDLLSRPQARVEMGQAGRALVEARFTWDVASGQMAELYQSLTRPKL